MGNVRQYPPPDDHQPLYAKQTQTPPEVMDVFFFFFSVCLFFSFSPPLAAATKPFVSSLEIEATASKLVLLSKRIDTGKIL